MRLQATSNIAFVREYRLGKIFQNIEDIHHWLGCVETLDVVIRKWCIMLEFYIMNPRYNHMDLNSTS